MAIFTPMSGGDFPDWDGGLDDTGTEVEGDPVTSTAGRCVYCKHPLDDHHGWSKGVWPYIQREPKLICEKWKPTDNGA